MGVFAGAWGSLPGSGPAVASAAFPAGRENLDFLPEAGVCALHAAQRMLSVLTLGPCHNYEEAQLAAVMGKAIHGDQPEPIQAHDLGLGSM